MRLTIFQCLVTLVLVLTLTGCGQKADSQEVPRIPRNSPEKISQISQQFSEVSPPQVIQELKLSLENYRPQVKIVTPQADEVIQDTQVAVTFQTKDIPIFKDSQLELGPHLHVIVDNEPYIAVYDLNQPLILSDLSPGTHTLRAFASRPWHESFKNEGAYAQTTFHIFTKTDNNNPDPSLPVLTYSRPQGTYGAEPILLDFYLTNAPVHFVAEDNPNDTLSDWRIRCTIDNESFILDRWQPIYLQGFKPGKNWVKLEFLDNQGNPLKNAFNTTARVINYQPNGKDTLSRIVRGELSADEARRIVDPNYTAKKTLTEPIPTPSIETTPSPQPIPETQIPETVVEPETAAQPETPKSEELVEPSPSLPPTVPEIIDSPASETQPEIVPAPVKEPENPKSQPPAAEQPELRTTDESTPLPIQIAPDPEEPLLKKYFHPRQVPNVESSPTVPSVVPETTPIPEEQEKPGEYKVTTMED